MKAAILHCRDKCACERKRKCAATDLKMCEVCGNVRYSTCDKAACKIDRKRPMMILPACSQSASAATSL